MFVLGLTGGIGSGKTALENGELNRAALREIIFNNTKEKEWLENCLHPVIRGKTREAIEQSTSAYTVLSAPLLLEKNLEFLTNKILVIDCPEAVQIDRTCRRDGSSIESVQKIMQQQLSRRERTAKADDVIVNDGTLDELNTAIDVYHFSLLKEINNSNLESNNII